MKYIRTRGMPERRLSMTCHTVFPRSFCTAKVRRHGRYIACSHRARRSLSPDALESCQRRPCGLAMGPMTDREPVCCLRSAHTTRRVCPLARPNKRDRPTEDSNLALPSGALHTSRASMRPQIPFWNTLSPVFAVRRRVRPARRSVPRVTASNASSASYTPQRTPPASLAHELA